jgi:hypothetical protein
VRGARAKARAVGRPPAVESELAAAHVAQMAAVRDAHPLPRLDGPADWVPYNINRLLANGAAWQPRPVAQSFEAFTPGLAARNARHFDGARAPRYVVAEIAPIDGRWPLLEDPLTWQALLRHYGLADAVPMPLLRRFPEPRSESVTALTVRFSEQGLAIPVAAPATYVRMTARYRRPLADRVAGALVRDPPLFAVLTLADGAKRRMRFLPDVAAAGFIASPLVENDRDLMGLLCGCDAALAAKRVATVGFEYRDGEPVPASRFDVALEAVTLSGSGVAQPTAAPLAVLRMRGDGAAPEGNGLLEVGGRIVRDAHAPSRLLLDDLGGAALCFGVREGGFTASAFDGTAFTATLTSGPLAGTKLVDEVVHPAHGTIREPLACRPIPQAARGASVVLETGPVGTTAYNWAYWYVEH